MFTGLLLACRSEARLRRRRKSSLVAMCGRTKFDEGLPPSTITQAHYHHQPRRHHQMMASSAIPTSASSYPTLTSTVDPESDVAFYGDRCCVNTSASFVDWHPLPFPVLDCACSDARFRPRYAEQPDDLRNSDSHTHGSDRRNSSSFKDAAADHLLRTSDAVLFPVADGAVNCKITNTETILPTVDVCRSCCSDSLVI